MNKYLKEHLDINFKYVSSQIERKSNLQEFVDTYHNTVRLLNKTPGINYQEYLTDLLEDYTDNYQRLAVLTILDVVKSEDKKNGYWGEGMGSIL